MEFVEAGSLEIEVWKTLRFMKPDNDCIVVHDRRLQDRGPAGLEGQPMENIPLFHEWAWKMRGLHAFHMMSRHLVQRSGGRGRLRSAAVHHLVKIR